jgi:hypothetical protein
VIPQDEFTPQQLCLWSRYKPLYFPKLWVWKVDTLGVRSIGERPWGCWRVTPAKVTANIRLGTTQPDREVSVVTRRFSSQPSWVQFFRSFLFSRTSTSPSWERRVGLRSWARFNAMGLASLHQSRDWWEGGFLLLDRRNLEYLINRQIRAAAEGSSVCF